MGAGVPKFGEGLINYHIMNSNQSSAFPYCSLGAHIEVQVAKLTAGALV